MSQSSPSREEMDTARHSYQDDKGNVLPEIKKIYDRLYQAGADPADLESLHYVYRAMADCLDRLSWPKHDNIGTHPTRERPWGLARRNLEMGHPDLAWHLVEQAFRRAIEEAQIRPLPGHISLAPLFITEANLTFAVIYNWYIQEDRSRFFAKQREEVQETLNSLQDNLLTLLRNRVVKECKDYQKLIDAVGLLRKLCLDTGIDCERRTPVPGVDQEKF